MENSQIRENFIEKKSSYGSIVALMVWFVFKCTPPKEFLIEKDKHGSIVGFLVSFKKSLEKERFENDLEQIFCLVIKIMLHLFKIYLFI